MTRRRRHEAEEDRPQERQAWADPTRVLDGAPAGEVVYQAPELKRRARASRPGMQSLGLPFGVRDADGRTVCWSCGHDVDETRVVRAGPGDVRCGGCGAKLPFH